MAIIGIDFDHILIPERFEGNYFLSLYRYNHNGGQGPDEHMTALNRLEGEVADRRTYKTGAHFTWTNYAFYIAYTSKKNKKKRGYFKKASDCCPSRAEGLGREVGHSQRRLDIFY